MHSGEGYASLMTPERYAEFDELRKRCVHKGYAVAHTFVPVVRRGAPRPILFVGRATRGWDDDKVSTLSGSHGAAEQLLNGVEKGRNSWPFFSQALQIAAEASEGHEPLPLAWTNLAKIGHPRTNPGVRLLRAQSDLCIKQLQYEIAKINPRAVVLMVGSYGEALLKAVFGIEGWKQDVLTEDRVASKLCDGVPVIWTNHPQTPSGRGHRKASREMVLRIIGGDWTSADWTCVHA